MKFEEWKSVKLGDLITHKKGFAFKSKDLVRQGHPIIKVSNFTDDSVNMENCFFINHKEASKYLDYQIFQNDIIIATVGSWPNNPNSIVGKVIKVPAYVNGSLLNQNSVILRAKNNISQLFIYYQLRNKDFSNHLIAGARGSANQASVTLEDIFNFDFKCPDIATQTRIAAILTSLDDKIELLHRQNVTLETMAETFFRQWFVVEAQNDWEELELGNVIETTSGGTPSRANMTFYENGDIHWVKSKELKGTFILETEEKITTLAVKKSSAQLLPKNSILIAMYGATVGAYAILSKEMTCNQAICALKPNKDYPYTYLFLYVKFNKAKLINMAVGSAQQNISQFMIKQLPIFNCLDRIAAFHSMVEPLFDKIKNNTQETQTLTTLRDSLLPKLMRGELLI